jgi:hypothetical protein
MTFGSRDPFAGYSHLDDQQLLQTAYSYQDLTDAAQQALREEFSRRDLEPPILDDLAEPAESRGLVTVHRYRDLSEAIVARSFLEASGIPVFLCDENLVRLDWQISNFIGGIRLQVGTKDEADALELLTQPPDAAICYQERGETYLQPRCPVCASTDITFQGASRAAALASLYLLAVPLPPGRETWICNACGARWEDEPEPSRPRH